jgi:hypothetical protein
MANDEHLAIIVKSGVAAWNSWRGQRLLHDSRAVGGVKHPDLQGADLRHYLLDYADLSGVNLSGANLSFARMSFANLYGADLRNAQLFSARLDNSILREANLDCADLTTARLNGSDLRSASLRGTKFSRAIFGRTSIVDVDLSAAQGLESVEHEAPSSIGIDTFFRSNLKSNDDVLCQFLRDAGVPGNLIQYAVHLVLEKAKVNYSCFISHSVQDKEFCDRLCGDLRNLGINYWYFPESAIWGRSIWDEIDRAIEKADRVILVCSKSSLESVPVLREIKRALVREDREHRSILFPIQIDGFIFSLFFTSPLKSDIMDKIVGDFSDWRHDETKYNAAFGRLVQALAIND